MYAHLSSPHMALVNVIIVKSKINIYECYVLQSKFI